MLKQFDVHIPIIQAPMAGVTSPAFVAASCEAGALGFIGAGYLDGQETKKFIQQVKNLTNKSFGVNVFIQEEAKIDVMVLQEARTALQPIYDELGIEGAPKVVSNELYEGQIQAILDEQVKIVSFTFGLPTQQVVERLKAQGTFLIGTATTKAEALAVEAAGLDAVVVQGSEAGGHRGSFQEPIQFISLHELLKQVAKEISIPIIAAGGIMTRQHVEEVLALGAVAAQIGTALLVADECAVSEYHKEAVLNSKEVGTCLTTAFTGKPARGLVNQFTEALKDAVIAPYPLQHHLTAKIRQESTKLGRTEYLSLWMGENSYLAKRGSVQEIISSLL